MRAHDLVLAAALLASAAGCLHNPVPRPRSMADVQSDAHGGYAVVSVAGQGVHSGELIAIAPSGVWVLSGGQLIHTPLERVAELEVHPYEVETYAVVTWGLLGTVSTISHGFFLIISAPVWLVTTSVVAAVHSRTAYEKYEGDNWPALAKWARFPQGLPPGLTATDLLYGRTPPALGPPSTTEPVGPPSPPSPPPAPPTSPPPLNPPPPEPAPPPTSYLGPPPRTSAPPSASGATLMMKSGKPGSTRSSSGAAPAMRAPATTAISSGSPVPSRESPT